MRVLITLALLIFSSGILHAQGRIVLNGGRVNITNGAVVVVANSAANAITRTSGHFISEGQNNRIKWNIGTATGARTIPFGTATGSYIPVTFTPSAATGATGYIFFATYGTAAQNSLTLPTGVTHFNSAVGLDASLTAVDRFWRIEALAYTARPTLSNLVFNYIDAEFAAPNKTTIENKLTARRWNSTTSTWQDYITGGAVNTTANTITIASLPAAQQFPWWSIQYPGAGYHWIANTQANYNTAANWSATAGGTGGLGIPSAGDAVFFDDVRDGNCVINTTMDVGAVTVATGYSGTISQGVNSVVIEGDANFASGTFSGGTASIAVNGNVNITGASFTSSSAAMDIKRNFTVSGSGTFAHNNGTLRFSGTSGTQTITAPSATFRSIDATNTSASPGLIFESNNQLAGVLTLGTNVVVDPDGASNNRIVTLLSSADSPTADAAIGILPAGASLNGQVTVQRYMSIEGASGGRIYRYISSPLVAATVADIQGEIPITGTFTGRSTCPGCTSSQSMFSYNESILTDINNSGVADFDDGYIDFPQNTNLETLVPGRGYAMFVRGNLIGTARWDVRGNINTANNGVITLPVSYTSSGVIANDGWNLVGNPFPSTINWNAASGWTKTNINGSIYIRDNAVAGGQYATWNGVVGTNGGSRFIATGQAFWVKASGAAPVLTVTENIKAAGTQAIFFKEETPSNLIRITLNQGSNRDEAVIHFRSDATSDFDTEADALKLPNAGFSLSTQLPGKEKLAINSIDLASCSTTATLVTDNIANGSYNFTFDELSTFSQETTITLHDAFTKSDVDVRGIENYLFTVTANPESSSKSRFSITIIQKATPMDYAVAATPVCEGADATIQIDKASDMNMYEAFVNDSLVWDGKGNNASLSFSVPSAILHSGNNAVSVRAIPMQGCASVTETTSLLIVDPIVSPQSAIAGSACREGEVKLSATGAHDGQQYHWYAAQDDTQALSSTGATFTTPVINKSRTYYVAIANALGCEGIRLPVAANIVQYDDPAILLHNDTLFVDYAGKKQWYVDGEKLSADTLSFIKPQRSGIYSVEIPVESCLATASVTYTLPEVITGTTPEATTLIRLYPNPVTKYLYFEQLKSSVKEIIVQNALGQFIGTMPLNNTGDLTAGKFDMSMLPSGLYLIQIRTATNKTEIKVIKE